MSASPEFTCSIASRNEPAPLSATDCTVMMRRSAARTARSTLTSPWPDAMSTPSSPISLAVESRYVRASRRSSSGSPPSCASSAGCASNISAAAAATCGAAADEPEKRGRNIVAALTVTPSIAASSGFCAPFQVGPRLEYWVTSNSSWAAAPTVIAPRASD